MTEDFVCPPASESVRVMRDRPRRLSCWVCGEEMTRRVRGDVTMWECKQCGRVKLREERRDDG